MRTILQLATLCVSLSTNAQFEILGPRFVQDPCWPHLYSIELDSLAAVEWSLWDGTNPGGEEIWVLFPGPGTYWISATVTTINGEEFTETIEVIVVGNPTTSYVAGCYVKQDSAAGCYQVCEFSTTTIYTEQGSEFLVEGAVTYDWLNNDVEIQWGKSGPGKVIVYYSGGCMEEICFDILPEPTAAFTASATAIHDTIMVCQGELLTFTDQSIGSNSIQWTFPDGSVSDETEIEHAFDTPGFHTVHLSAKSICDCEDSKTIVVNVIPTPTPTLDCVNSVCPGTRQHYNATTDGCTIFHWNVSSNGTIVNGGGINDDFIEVIWDGGPDGVVELSVEGCNTAYCTAPNEFRIPIISPTVPIAGDAVICPGDVRTYAVPYFPGTTYTWSLGGFGTIENGQNSNAITVKWADGNIAAPSEVRVQYENCFLECGGEGILPISFKREIVISGDREVCYDDMGTIHAFTSFSQDAHVNWHIEDASGATVYTHPLLTHEFTHVYNYPPGFYEVVATNTTANYCNEEVRHALRVIATPAPPKAIIGDSIICPGELFGYTIDPAGNYATIWTITDGSSTVQLFGNTISWQFGNSAPYRVTAVHADIQFPACTSDPVVLELKTLNNYSVTGADEVCLYDLQSYTFPYSSGVDYTWEIIPAQRGEIRRSDLNTVEVFWTESGNATLQLTACGHVIEYAVDIRPLPGLAFVGPTSACEGEQIVMATDQPGLQHRWYDEDDQFISGSPSVLLQAGTFAAEVTDGFGCTTKQSVDITVNPTPVVNLSSPEPLLHCNTLPGGLRIVANTDGAYYVYTWFFNHVNMGTGGPTYPVNNFGTYQVMVTNQYGCSSLSKELEFVNCCPPDDCGFPICSLPGCTYITNGSTDVGKDATDCSNRKYEIRSPAFEPNSVVWGVYSVGDKIIAVQATDEFQFAYDKPGYYFLEVVYRLPAFSYSGTDCGHIYQFRDTIRAVADFMAEGHCANAPVSFEDLTTFLPGESIASWNWNFGDPASGADNVSASQHPDHVFATAGTYTITLTVTMASGCSTRKQLAIDVSGGPSLNPVFAPEYCEHEAQSFSIAPGLFDVSWDFGDPASGIQNTADANDVLHTFDTPGAYIVNVSAADVYGCQSTAVLPVNIVTNTLAGDITENPNGLVCFGEEVQLTASPGGVAWQWSNDATTEIISVNESGTYQVIVTDVNHCTYEPDPVVVEITPKPEVTIGVREILADGTYGPWDSTLHVCFGAEFELQAFSSMPGVTYKWENGSIQASRPFTNEGSNPPNPGIHEFTVFVTSGANCRSDTAHITIEIFARPDIPLLALTAGNACSHTDNELSVINPDNTLTYVWSNGYEGPVQTTKAEGEFFVTAISEHGCINKSDLLTIKPGPEVDQIPGGCYLKCDPLTVCLPPIQNVTAYNLYHNGFLIQSGSAWPNNFIINTDGEYYIEVTSANGCKSTSDPLNISLYTGVGSITVLTYYDTDGDGVISAADALLPGLPVIIESHDGAHYGSALTEAGGEFVFPDYPATGYTALFDPAQFPSQYEIVIDSADAVIATCDDSVVVSLLVRDNCFVTGPDVYLEMCDGDDVTLGDSTWSETGTYEMHMESAFGCDSVFDVHVNFHDTLEIHATVWVDVDGNGIVSAGDTVIEGITIVIDRGINQAPFIEVTDENGFISGEYNDGPYMVFIDSTLLPGGLEIIYGFDFVDDTACFQTGFNFLLTGYCTNVYHLTYEALCAGDSLLVEGDWITGPGVYSFILGPSGLCDSILEVTVDTLPAIHSTALTDWSCITLGSIDLEVAGGTGPLFIEWSDSLAGQHIELLPADEYTYSITDDNGCKRTGSAIITEEPLLNFSIDSFFEIGAGESISITIAGDIHDPGLQIQWLQSGILNCATCPNVIATPTQDTVLNIALTDANGCAYWLETQIVIREDSAFTDELYVPNVFTPNGDGFNDHWFMTSRLPDAFVSHIAIFDRWGNHLYEKTDFDLVDWTGWDGTFHGRKMNPGVYAFTGRVRLSDGEERLVKGDITLVR